MKPGDGCLLDLPSRLYCRRVLSSAPAVAEWPPEFPGPTLASERRRVRGDERDRVANGEVGDV